MKKPYRKLTHITPEWAAKHPAHKTHQRNKSALHANRITELIRNGQFIEGDLCPTPIHIDEDGYCIDGQHRLAAIIAADVTVEMPVIFNSTSELVEKDHVVKARSVVDRAMLISRRDYDKTAHTVTQYAFSSARKLRDLDVYLWLARFEALREHYDLFKSTGLKKEAGRIGLKAAGVASVMGVCLRATALGEDATKVHTFFDNFCSNGGAAIPKNLFMLRMKYNEGLNGSDTIRHAFNLVAQQALVDYLKGSRRQTAYKLPLVEVTDAKGVTSLKVIEDDVIPVPYIPEEVEV